MTGFHGRENKMARVTVIEEQITTRKQMGAMLELMGHVVDLHENGCSFAERGAAFRTFLERNRPDDLESPTQPAGVIRSDLKGGGA